MPARSVPALATRLSRAYAALAHGLTYPGSESEAPYEPFAADLHPQVPLTEISFRDAAELAAWWLIDFEEAEEWFAVTIAYSRDPEGGADPAAAEAYVALRRAMLATLDPPVRRVRLRSDGATFHKTGRYLIGRVPGGGLAGLVVRSVET